MPYWLRIVLVGMGLLLLSFFAALGIGYVVNHWILSEELWPVIDILIGAIFGFPLFVISFVFFLKRSRRHPLLRGRR